MTQEKSNYGAAVMQIFKMRRLGLLTPEIAEKLSDGKIVRGHYSCVWKIAEMLDFGIDPIEFIKEKYHKPVENEK